MTLSINRPLCGLLAALAIPAIAVAKEPDRWWSLRPLSSPAIPAVADPWPRSPADAFIHRRLTDNRLRPAPEADRRTLSRRLHFDLTGLPPTPGDVERFVTDTGPDAEERLVDRLLASPHFGERWGRHWLDVARYGESDGFERNNPRKNSWPYRDWVIESLNADMPFDRFARMQIAGDVLAGDADGIAATGFLVAGVHNTVVGQSERMKLLARQDELEEITGTLSQAFLGMTAHCARCHDHKYDPIPQRDYYRLTAALAGVRHGERPAPPTDVAAELRDVGDQLNSLGGAISALERPVRAAILRERRGGEVRPEPPTPLLSWEFAGPVPDGVTLHGNARIEGGALVLDGQSHAEAGGLPADLTEKTLEAWVMLDDLKQQGGGVISVQTPDGVTFDAIVFGEREPGRWMAGSEFFRRTQPFEGEPETAADERPVHVAIAYHADGTIAAYRDGKPYGKGYSTARQGFAKGEANVLFGLRHSPPGGNRFLKGKLFRARVYDTALSADAVAASAGVPSTFISEAELSARLTQSQARERSELLARTAELESRRGQLEKLAARETFAVVPGDPGITRVLVRGDVAMPGETVTAAGIAAVGPTADFGLPEDAGEAQRRRNLAEWVTHPENPLFARVIVNRLWHHHFGTGIVATPSDLGKNGGTPSHPELLDWLASELARHGHGLKAIHREIVLSAAYRQSARSDPAAVAADRDNRLLWRYPRRRLDAESLRDAMLRTAGRLNPRMGGPGFEDSRANFQDGTTYYAPFDAAGPAFDRRTVYRFSPRGGRSSLLDTFDCPDGCSAAPRRSVTTTPLQALSLLNGPFSLRMGDAFAARVRREAGGDTDTQVERAFELALARPPVPEEARLAAELVRAHGLSALCRALFNGNEFVILD